MLKIIKIIKQILKEKQRKKRKDGYQYLMPCKSIVFLFHFPLEYSICLICIPMFLN